MEYYFLIAKNPIYETNVTDESIVEFAVESDHEKYKNVQVQSEIVNLDSINLTGLH